MCCVPVSFPVVPGATSKAFAQKMADDQRGLLSEERADKRKCDEFAALYGLEGAAAARALPDHSGKFLPLINSINQAEL